MWVVYEHKKVTKALKKLPREVLINYELWKRIVELDGPKGLKLIKGFHDEALQGQRKNQRSSRLNKQWRVIYTMEKSALHVYVLEINPHQY